MRLDQRRWLDSRERPTRVELSPAGTYGDAIAVIDTVSATGARVGQR
jgi:hypothetical protein